MEWENHVTWTSGEPRCENAAAEYYLPPRANSRQRQRAGLQLPLHRTTLEFPLRNRKFLLLYTRCIHSARAVVLYFVEGEFRATPPSAALMIRRTGLTMNSSSPQSIGPALKRSKAQNGVSGRYYSSNYITHQAKERHG